MNYYIYENWVVEKKAVIHRESCSFCNQGEGVHKDKEDGKNGCWHGSFPDFEAAMQYARTLNRNIRCCNHCAPDTGHNL